MEMHLETNEKYYYIYFYRRPLYVGNDFQSAEDRLFQRYKEY